MLTPLMQISLGMTFGSVHRVTRVARIPMKVRPTPFLLGLSQKVESTFLSASRSFFFFLDACNGSLDEIDL